MKKIYLLTIILFSLSFLSVYSQISEGGIPPSFNYQIGVRTAIPSYEVPIDFDSKRLIWEDSIVASSGVTQRAAKSVAVLLNMDSIGTWRTLPDFLQIWQLSIHAKDAEGLILGYKDFYIPQGGKLFIYNEDKTQIIGAYTDKTNPKGGLFATEMLVGSAVTLEYVASSISTEKPRIIIDDIGYVYDDRLLVRVEARATNDVSWSCMININCIDGRDWQKQKRGVVKLLVYKDGWYYCSGSIINNTAEDGKPYLLTASHCYDGNSKPEKTVMYFNYEYETCTNGGDVPSAYPTMTGIDILVNTPLGNGGDGILAILHQDIPDDWHPYYNGWDVRNIAAKSGVVIHHPNGDLKKITSYINPLTSETYEDLHSQGARNAHWKVVYDGRSVTQGGSSGSPIFNEDGLIVGSLTGGSSTCFNKYYPDYYAKLWYNWEQYGIESGNSTQKMKTYLDPLNKGIQTLKGFDPNPPTGIEDEWEVETRNLIIFPNPADADLNINSRSIIRELDIYDLSGRNLYKVDSYNASTISIPISSWQKGIYTVTIKTDAGDVTEKFIKK